MIQGIIGKPAIIQNILAPLNPVQATVEQLQQGFELLFLCEILTETICRQVILDNTGGLIKPFDFLDSRLEKYLETASVDGYFAYIETDYFGGAGTQAAGIFNKGKLVESYKSDTGSIDISIPWPERLLDEPINKVLRKIGVQRTQGLDEFDNLGLGNHRHMPYNEI